MEEATPQEIEWALAIREAARKDPDVNTDQIVDLEYLQHAIVAKEKVQKALCRIKRVQKFKEMYGIKLDGSYDEGMRSLKTYLDLFPGFFLAVGVLEDGTHLLSANFSRFYKRTIKTEESLNVLIRGFYYLLQSCQPNIAAMRAGMIYLGETQGAGWQNYSLKVENRVASVYSNAYPIRIQRMVFMHVPFLFRLFFKMWRPFVSKKVFETFVYAADRESFLQQASISAAALPAEWGGSIDPNKFREILDKNLRERYELAAKFRLASDTEDDNSTRYESDTMSDR